MNFLVKCLNHKNPQSRHALILIFASRVATSILDFKIVFFLVFEFFPIHFQFSHLTFLNAQQRRPQNSSRPQIKQTQQPNHFHSHHKRKLIGIETSN